MDAWTEEAAGWIAGRAEREIEALVAVSSPSGDAAAAEEAVSVASVLLPSQAVIERPACSSPDHAPDLLATVAGTGSGRLLLLGHLDTVVGHGEHRPLERVGDRLVGSGTIDMKAGVVLALGVLRALAQRRHAFAEVALLLVMDEEWRVAPFAHAERFAGFDACLCFEGGELTPEGEEGVVVRRKAAGTVRIDAAGVAAHSGSAPDDGCNALLALASSATIVAALHDPDGPDRLSVVPTIIRSGDAFNVVPARGELFCDLRADRLEAFDAVIGAVPREAGGAILSAELLRAWPGMDSAAVTARLLEEAGAQLGRPVAAVERGGASDASHLATVVPATVDGLGPRGGAAHNPEEYVLLESLRPRAELALSLAAAALRPSASLRA